MKVNLNDRCRVTLRESGAKRLNENAEYYAKKFPNASWFQGQKPYSAGDVYSAQLWSIMQDFGDLIQLGALPPFETEMEIEP